MALGMLCELFKLTQPIGVGSEVLAGLLHSVSVCTSSLISRDAVGAEIKVHWLSWASGL